MSIMIDAEKAMEALRAILAENDRMDNHTIAFNMGLGAAISELEHMAKEAEEVGGYEGNQNRVVR